MDLGKPIAYGRTAEIYAWKDGQILKLFHPFMKKEWIDSEARTSVLVQASGLPTPHVGETVKVEDRWGLIFQKIEGPSMLKRINQKPLLAFSMAIKLGKLHAATHKLHADTLPSQRARLTDRIQRADELNDAVKTWLLEELAALPDDNTVCHGDFHPDNILMTRDGPVIIDWSDACQGNPTADIARTLLMLAGGAPPPEVKMNPIIGLGRSYFTRLYLYGYSSVHRIDWDQLRRWKPLVAAARLREQISEEQETLVRIVMEAWKEKNGG
jgi:uncharacterized protein (TIGR02172 family)